ncbi:hypothetical protein SCLCIDRAFT_29582 [Scleroderma citrinum Foug A]|uniref:Uncharacterized protein n=1 Tax=Scleroderma citrinum Foug A TaxID=1036808 RepID=A0A0C3DK38_9AGAM|nr:hypothetical protein SCLCIDRAFT_29582 [Scleroderma citrinum Foug A]
MATLTGLNQLHSPLMAQGLCPPQGHTECIRSVAFSPDGTEIVSGSWDNTERVWDADKEVRTINNQGKASLQELNECSICFLNNKHGVYAPFHSDAQHPIPHIQSIRFSSMPSHALHDKEKLCFHDKQAFHQCVRLHEDGWIRGPHGQLLL